MTKIAAHRPLPPTPIFGQNPQSSQNADTFAKSAAHLPYGVEMEVLGISLEVGVEAVSKALPGKSADDHHFHVQDIHNRT